MTDRTKVRKTLTGVVVSDKMTNSIVVRTERTVRHKLYGKMIRLHKKAALIFKNMWLNNNDAGEKGRSEFHSFPSTSYFSFAIQERYLS